ncbi:ribonuclease H-like protein [Megavirus chiliensis]|uniref:ribonuclease H n=2 Tax=Megamimivirinae TaxID=3044648 RepID=A0A2L2DMP7_MIMIV|nr:Rnase H [Megavirus chiliensis]AEQ32548.1 ribonuclease H-like protein [Megavirus chiliensis]AVG47445.1 ribonuclease H [Acanthamoeba polyphaga mimivirus]
MYKKTRKIDIENVIVFTDGSCVNNGRKHAVGGIGIHFPDRTLNDISRIFTKGCCTNQRTELYAILYAIKYVHSEIGLQNCILNIFTDSQYSINCITKWVPAWIKNNWRTKNNTAVANREFIEPIYRYYNKYNINFTHVDAHTGRDDYDSIANAKADYLATKATKKAISEKKNSHEVIRGGSKTNRGLKTRSQNKSNNINSSNKRNYTSNKSNKINYTPIKSYKSYKPEYSDDIIIELVKN